GSLLKSRNAGPDKSKQNALAPPLGTSPRLGVPVIRQRGLTGRLRSKQIKIKSGSLRIVVTVELTELCRYLCCDCGTSFNNALTDTPQSQASQLPLFALRCPQIFQSAKKLKN
ncbi:hypothetical protein, partial [Pseudomonas fluorescens]